MPELPEVETVVRDLRPLLTGQHIRDIRRTTMVALRRPWDESWVPIVRGRTIHTVERRGKWIEIALGQQERATFLVVHLGMTGQLTVAAASEPFQDHTHLVADLDNGNQLRYRDIRRFGSVSVFRDRSEVDAFHQAQQLGPEPFDLDKSHWLEQLAGTTRLIKSVLLDQTVVAGVGNIYADESLFVARIHPTRRACDLKPREAERLRQAMVAVLARAIDRRGSTIRNYVGGSGLQGEFQDEFQAYGRTGQECVRCQTPMECLRLGGRASHFCPRCQPAN
ncbi:MAG: bifunctional DNA-formamidopyrimidine glycosylase/DNA-(apurinic or apyrimidinic site) lyase [Gemmataceae bacterium]